MDPLSEDIMLAGLQDRADEADHEDDLRRRYGRAGDREAEVAAKLSSRADFMRKRIDWSPVLDLHLTPEWIGSDLFLKLDDERRAIVSFVTQGCAEHYTSMFVRVVNKRSGEVDRKHFPLNEHLRDVPRADSRRDYEGSYQVVSHCSWDWYIAVPSSTLPLTEAIAAYVALFV